jgi:Mrp family chromosome partitioning ATPase
MPTDRPADDVRKSRAAQRAERLGRLRATALSTVIENPAPRGLPPDEPAIIAGGLPCQDEVLADMALPLPELPAAETLLLTDTRPNEPGAGPASTPPLPEDGQGKPAQASDRPAGQLAGRLRVPWDDGTRSVPASSVSPGEHASLVPHGGEPTPADPSSVTSAFVASKSEQPPLAQPSSQVFRFDSAEGLSPRPPFAMPAFSLAKSDQPQPPDKPDKAEPSAYPVSELYRQVRQNVLGQLAVGQAAIVWISPTGSEPLGDHLVELASALAEGCDGEILLVDANFQSASLTRRFNLGDKSGLADVLAKKLAAQAAGHETAVARVRVLPKGGDAAGRASRRANEEEWRTLLAGLKERYRYVLIDAPGVEEPHCLPLAKAADAAFVAIALDHTPRETVQEALEHLHLHKARVAGCVITESPV